MGAKFRLKQRVLMMKQLRTSGKTFAVIFMVAFLAACSGNTKQNEASQEAERRAQEAAAEAQRKEERLRDAISAAGDIIYFAYDSSVMTTEGRRVADAHIALLQTKNSNVKLEGHTDERGTREYNLALGERRANAVRDYMVVNGVSSGRIETVSYGEEDPMAMGSGEASWSQNRRVAIQ